MMSSSDRVVYLRVAESQELKTISPSEQIALKDNKDEKVEAEAKAEEQPVVATVNAVEERSDVAENLPPEEEYQEVPLEIKLETAPVDFPFPTTNQTRHCFTRYIEYHRCVAEKGKGEPECDKFQKYYRSLCPGEWIDRWNEHRENGTFPGPL